jgi:hypothetical protein
MLQAERSQGSIPEKLFEFFNVPNPPSRITALGIF